MTQARVSTSEGWHIKRYKAASWYLLPSVYVHSFAVRTAEYPYLLPDKTEKHVRVSGVRHVDVVFVWLKLKIMLSRVSTITEKGENHGNRKGSDDH